jgi:NTP pyrophosphatase (non-canonical NTP hydrolase)
MSIRNLWQATRSAFSNIFKGIIMPLGNITGAEVVTAAESAAVNIIEAGLAGGVAGAEVAAVKELAQAAGEVVSAAVTKSDADDVVSKSSVDALPNQTPAPVGPSVDEGVGKTLPPDTTYAKITQWANDRNIIAGSNAKDQFVKLISEIGELSDAISKGDEPAIIDGIGDAIVVLTIIAAQYKLSIPDCIDAAYNEIKDRKGVMYNGVFIKADDARYAGILAELGKA